eukprot:Rhum_TRINITY_DN24990_c0_g1::Rhum_TRINITY_DN24990_c0_g1_i1::g.180773::m.180773/K03014/RPB6, POLR2F; DNA-directed RNA polymerases I, II, and III subunit RPABC2
MSDVGSDDDRDRDPDADFDDESEADDADIVDEFQDQKQGVEIMDKTDPINVKRLEDRITTRFLTKYERARILGIRALQISMGAPVKVELDGETDPLIIASKELREKKIPIVIRRNLPDGSFEDWPIDDLVVDMDRTIDGRYRNIWRMAPPDLKPV